MIRLLITLGLLLNIGCAITCGEGRPCNWNKIGPGVMRTWNNDVAKQAAWHNGGSSQAQNCYTEDIYDLYGNYIRTTRECY